MAVRSIDPLHIAHDEDWEGDNAAFSCPICGKVFIVIAHAHGGKRDCPECAQSTGNVSGLSSSDRSAWIEWPNSD